MIEKQSPKQAGFRMPAEWHSHARCWMAWPCHAPTWEKIGLQKARTSYANVAKAIAQYEPVSMLVNPQDKEIAQKLCGQDIELFVLPLNDSWMRDTGPTFLLNKKNELAGVNWLHNAWGRNYEHYELDQRIAGHVLNQMNAHSFHADLVMEGGSFHVDGEGTILTTKECLLNANRNPHLSQKQIEHYLCEYLGGDKVIWLNKGLLGDGTDGHVDEIATFVSPGKVLCLTTEDKTDPNFASLQENVMILQNSKDAKGRPLEVFTVEQPPATMMKGERLTLSYINFYLANQGIVMPAFGYEDYDKAAYRLFAQLFPGYALSQIDGLDIFAGGGGIHCITQQQPCS
jgi:agmatine deiminase